MSNGSYKILVKDSPPTRVAASPYSALLAWLWKSARDIYHLLKYVIQLVKRPIQKVFGIRTTNTPTDNILHKIAEIGVGFAEVTDNLSRHLFNGYRIIPISYWSRIIEWFIKRPETDYRRLFEHSISTIPLIWISGNHSHRLSATYRTSANMFLKRLVSEKGYVPYQISCAISDVKDSDGTRYFYGFKDLKTPFKHTLVDEKHVIIMTDVDYYADMNEILKLNRPIIMYSFYPRTPGETRKEYTYSINDDVVEYHVSGGAHYKHKLWDYSGDTVTALDDDLSLIVYDISQRYIENDEDHRIVGLYPTCKVPFPFWLHFSEEIGIKHRKFSYGNYSVTRSPNHLHISPSGTPQSFKIKESLYGSLLIRGERKTNMDLTVADIERHLNFDKNEFTNAESANAAAHVRQIMEHLPFEKVKEIPMIAMTIQIRACYQSLKPLLNEDGRESCLVITSPLVTQPAVFPCRSYNNDVACIMGRVEKVKNTTWPDKELEIYADEFVKKLVCEGDYGKGNPLSLSDVAKIQDRPMQQARIKRDQVNMSIHAENKLQAFVKSEAYSNFTDPRNITTMTPNVTTMLSSYTYAFKEALLKKCPWYAPGLTPELMLHRDRKSVV